MPKNKIDSIAGNVEIISASGQKILPPSHIEMSKEDMPFFRNVINEFAYVDWTEHKKEIAAILARTMCDMEREQRLLRDEGSVAYSEKGTPVCNPRKTIVQMHASTVLSLRKSLGMDARAKGDARDLAKQAKLKKDIQSKTQQEDDYLIPKAL